MQNTDEYTRSIHTTGQAAQRIHQCCSVFGYRLAYRLLTTFQAAILFVLALQTNDVILKGLESQPFDFTQFGIIMSLVLIAIVFEYIKEQFVAEYNCDGSGVASAAANIRHAYAHSFHQV